MKYASQQQDFKALFDCTLDAIMVADDEARYIAVNPAACQMLRASESDILGRTVSDFTSPVHHERSKQRWHHFLQVGQIEGELELIRLDGSRCLVEYRARANFRPGQHLSVLRDVSRRKKSEEHLHFLAEAGSVLSSSLDYDHSIQSLAALATVSLADWCAIDIVEAGEVKRAALVHKEPDKVALLRDVHQLFPLKWDATSGVAQVLRTGESQFWQEVPDSLLAEIAPNALWLETMRGLGLKSILIVPLVARGETVGAMTLVRERPHPSFDASDLIVAQEMARRAGSAVENGRMFRHMTQALRRAEEASRARDEFLAVVSHELKTPMTPIMGWISLLKAKAAKEELALWEPQLLQHAIDVIERNVMVQSQLVNDLLDVSRIITGKLHLDIKSVDMASVVGFALEAVRLAAQAKNITISFKADSDLEPIYGDAERLQQVVWNLLSNAIKFTPAQGKIRISLCAIDDGIELLVADNGQGIDAGFMPYMFDRFRQADSSSTREHGGLGLGLSIVRNLVDLHGGSVTVESPGVGLGATFKVRLPRPVLPLNTLGL